MSFLSALGLLVGLVSGGISIYEFTKNRKRPGTILALTAIGILLAAYLVANPPFSSAQSRQGFAPIVTSGTSQPSTDSTSSPVTPSATPTPTPKPVPGTVLYQADQSWRGWSGSADWKVSGGMLVNDATSTDPSTNPTITTPYSLEGIANYAVEIKMTLVTPLDPNVTYGNYPCFNILVRGASTTDGWEGYQAGFYYIYPPYSAWIKGAQDQQALVHAPFNPGKAEHTYRVEVSGNHIKFLIDGGLKVETTDLRYSSGGQVGMEAYELQLEISSFKIIAL